MNNQRRKARPEIIINSNEPSFYPYSVKIVSAEKGWFIN